MNIKRLGAEHSVAVDLLPDVPLVLDVGCRGFDFDRELLRIREHAFIWGLDPDPEIKAPEDLSIEFSNRALTEKHTKTVRWQGEGDGAYICGPKGDPGYGWPAMNNGKDYEVPNITISQFLEENGYPPLDLVKLDCEGSEFGILENWPGPIATQISVEFHDFIDRNRWNDAYFKKLFEGPLKDYNVVLFRLTPLGPANSLGHWDSLLVRK